MTKTPTARRGFGANTAPKQTAAQQAAALHVTPVAYRTDCGVEVVTGISDGDCVVQAVVAHQTLGGRSSGWTIEAGVLVAYDRTFGEWDSPWQMGHVWLWHEEQQTLLDVTAPGWSGPLAALRFKLNPGARTAAQQGRASATVLPCLDRLAKQPTVAGCDLLYIPGVTAVDYVDARTAGDAAAKAAVRQQYRQHGALWAALAAATAGGECCSPLLETTLGL